MTRIKRGVHVNVCDGPHCGSNGVIDFVDAKGRRALVEDDHYGLAWVPFRFLRQHNGQPLTFPARRISAKATNQ